MPWVRSPKSSATSDVDGRRLTSVVALALGVVASAAIATVLLVRAVTDHQVDLAVFQDAGAAYLNGMPLYSEDFPTRSGLRFIYAPIAAVLFAPLTLLGSVSLQLIWTAVNIALVWWVLISVLRKLDVSRPALLGTAALGVALLLEPVRSNFGFGQINIILMALVVADCTGAIPRRLRGVGIALAASIKITPAAFGLFLLVRRDFASIARAVAAVGIIAALGFWLLPGASAYFWLTEFFATERGGGHGFSRNQAFTGVLARLGADGVLKDALWAVFAAIVVAAAAWSARRFARSGENMVAFAIVALASLLAAPFAVSHHWVYSVLLIPLALAPQYRSWRPMLLAAIVVFAAGPHTVLSAIDSDTGLFEIIWRQALGNAQCFTAIALLIAAVLQARKRITPIETAPQREMATATA
ncbi:MAG: glycosyltransferase family 87 protein [Rhodococcus sp. (in: high G+C Gram-positive bacteria)]|uniref:glycosyltransferase family 87 protein n=1 Tax=Rhodococcus sp. TaxID=1831 RepID=UPI002AD72B5C|nr:glycosyltransferase family 87 protein [Rhodococcus sp. (in: high G+C Gram-positive bacteria)]MDZ7930682.1 glycosyltransferase family 87 protein [Rhodococcus sp. (in: high G+C Gram-positive bacteria)]